MDTYKPCFETKTDQQLYKSNDGRLLKNLQTENFKRVKKRKIINEIVKLSLNPEFSEPENQSPKQSRRRKKVRKVRKENLNTDPLMMK